jgi:hypothetical protein
MSDTPTTLADAMATLVDAWDAVFALAGGPEVLYKIFGSQIPGCDVTAFSIATTTPGRARQFAGSEAQPYTAELIAAATG